MTAVLLNAGNTSVLLGTSYIHPVEDLPMYEEGFRNAAFKGYVLIDALLSNGFSSNRFVKVYFDGQHFDQLNSLEIVENVSDDVLKAVYSWFMANPNVVDANAVLPNAQRWILKKGTLLKAVA